MEMRQENMELALAKRQQDHEKELAEKNRRIMELKMAVITGNAASQFKLMAQNSSEMQKTLAEITRNMTVLSQFMATNITTGTTTVTQMSDMNSTDQSMFQADMSGEKRNAADSTNHTQAFNSQVAPTDGLSTQEEPTFGAASD